MSRNARCLVIAEVAQAHDGSLGSAHAYIDAIARAGADAVKFQTHLAAAESSPAEPWRVNFSVQDATRYDYWVRTSFTQEQWRGLREHAFERGLEFLSSPFSVDAAELLLRVGVSAWKIPSGEVTNVQLLDFVAGTSLPVLLSTGMSPVREIDRAVERLRNRCPKLTVMQCTSAYPCPPEKIGLNLLDSFRKRYGCGVGLSDHSGTVYAGLAAATLGIDALEVHVTFSRECFGPDVAASLTTSELKQLVEGVRFIERMLHHNVDKDAAAGETSGVRALFTKSVVAKSDLRAGTVLSEADLTTRKPGTGISADMLPELVGRTLRRPVAAGEFLDFRDIADVRAARTES